VCVDCAEQARLLARLTDKGETGGLNSSLFGIMQILIYMLDLMPQVIWKIKMTCYQMLDARLGG